MGIGDEIMAAGHAEVEAKRTGQRVCILDRDGNVRSSPIWDGNPHISQTMDPSATFVRNGSGCRPYIKSWTDRQIYSAWRARDHRGHIYLSEAEKRRGTLASMSGPYVLIEPNIKAGANPNKRWARDRYQRVVDEMKGIRFVQVGPPGAPLLRGVIHEATSTFREGCGVLSRALAYVGPEGALHHAAAALGVPAVVIFGGSPSVQATGYPEQINFGTDNPCGRWGQCDHCSDVMSNITVEKVLEGLQCLLN